MTKPSPFKNNPALYLIVAVPVLAVIVGISMLVVSIYSFDGLVVDDYYKKGKEINVTLERDKIARDLDLFADFHLDEENSIIVMNLSATPEFEPPAKIDLQFLHRTLSGKDIKIELDNHSGLSYRGELPELSESRWLVELGTEKWRLTGGVVWPVEKRFELESKSTDG